MARVDITLNGRTYPISCDDGQEARVRQIAEYLGQKVEEVRSVATKVSELHLLVMGALLITDELFDLRTMQEHADRPTRPVVDDQAVAQAIEKIQHRVEGLATKLKRT